MTAPGWQVDGLIVSRWGPEVFASMRAGGVTAANCTVSVWEGFQGTMDNVAQCAARARRSYYTVRQAIVRDCACTCCLLA